MADRPSAAEPNPKDNTDKIDLEKKVVDLTNENSRLIILGDFNIAPADQDVHDPKEWAGCVLVSKRERNEFEKLLSNNMTDCFRIFNNDSGHYSWWDYRAASFRRNRGVRIDHILASKTMSGLCKACYIDKNPRKLERPSDHTPVVGEFDI